jgi:DNA-binding MarR family transcriptional regulator
MAGISKPASNTQEPPESSVAVPPLIGALLRVPAQTIHRRLIEGLNSSGFPDLLLPHMSVIQYPGPDGRRPGELAERSGMSKQAMNQLLQSLERLGYVRRTIAEDDGRARAVEFTARGRAAYTKMAGILEEIEDEWRAALGDERFGQLKQLLGDAWRLGLV